MTCKRSNYQNGESYWYSLKRRSKGHTKAHRHNRTDIDPGIYSVCYCFYLYALRFCSRHKLALRVMLSISIQTFLNTFIILNI